MHGNISGLKLHGGEPLAKVGHCVPVVGEALSQDSNKREVC